MQVELSPPFPGPIPARLPRPLGPVEVLSSLALAGVGIGFGISAHRLLRDRSRIHCAPEMLEDGDWDVPIVGVDVSYEGDWWADRGERLYWEARRSGARTAADIGIEIIAADIGSDSSCMEQFPPHAGTHEQNAELWYNLLQLVQRQMAQESAQV